MTKDEAEKLCKLWQRRLRLQDWNIQIEIKRLGELPEDCQACIYPLDQHKAAEMHLLDPIDSHINGAWDFDLELNIVHELLHLHLRYVEPEDDDEPRYIAFEQAINLISEALVSEIRIREPGRARSVSESNAGGNRKSSKDSRK